jgi:hypothetical protein
MKKNKLEEGLFLSRNPAAQDFSFFFPFWRSLQVQGYSRLRGTGIFKVEVSMFRK